MRRTKRKRSQNKIGGAAAERWVAESADDSLPLISSDIAKALKARVWKLRAENPNMWRKKLAELVMHEMPELITPTVNVYAAKAHIQRVFEEYDSVVGIERPGKIDPMAASADDSLQPLRPSVAAALNAGVWKLRADNPKMPLSTLAVKIFIKLPELAEVGNKAAKEHIRRAVMEYDEDDE
jgi:hypothetical protein